MLAIAGGKGGCGKTTTAFGLAAAAGTHGVRTLVVDADVDMPDCHLVGGVKRAAEHRSEPDERDRRAPPDSGPPPRPQPSSRFRNVAVRPAPIRSDHPVTASELRTPGWPLTIVDTAAGAGPDAVSPLAVADRTLLVSTTDRAALRDTAKTAAMAEALGSERLGVVLVGTDAPPEGVRTLLDAPVLATVPSVDGRPLDSRRVRRQYVELAGSLGLLDGVIGVDHSTLEIDHAGADGTAGN